jgi:hypothetical protein
MKSKEQQITRRRCLTLIAAAAAATRAPGFCWGEKEVKFLRMAVSAETLSGANINDARAAYKVWINEISRSSGQTPVEIVPDVFIPSENLIRDVRQGTIQCYGITAIELRKVVDWTDPDFIVIQDYLSDGLEYVLLVHANGPFKKLADLHSAQIVSLLQRDMVLLPAWLDTVLAANNLPAAEHFFTSISFHEKVNQVLLPVFFRHADGACVGRQSWEAAVELNPQLGRDLRLLAVSPKIIPNAIFFHRDCDAEGRRLLIDLILHISSTAAGKQIAALYQSSGFVVRPISAMKNSLDMVREFARLPAQQLRSRKGLS